MYVMYQINCGNVFQALKETLRLYPSATGTLRVTDRDEMLNGLFVPAKTNVIVSMNIEIFLLNNHTVCIENCHSYVGFFLYIFFMIIKFSSFIMGRLPDYWKNPEEFNPLRFEEEEGEKR